MKSEPTEIASNTNVRAIEVDPTAAAGTLRERIAKETPDKRPFAPIHTATGGCTHQYARQPEYVPLHRNR